MGEKGIAVLVAAVIAPLCAVCILGPVLLGSAVAWVSGWFSGLGPVVATSLAIIVGLAVYGLVRWGRARATARQPMTAHHSQQSDKPAQ